MAVAGPFGPPPQTFGRACPRAPDQEITSMHFQPNPCYGLTPAPGRIAGVGIQTQRGGGGPVNRLFYRMDIHLPNPGHGHPGGIVPPGAPMGTGRDELCPPWSDGIYHFHVMKYTRSGT